MFHTVSGFFNRKLPKIVFFDLKILKTLLSLIEITWNLHRICILLCFKMLWELFPLNPLEFDLWQKSDQKFIFFTKFLKNCNFPQIGVRLTKALIGMLGKELNLFWVWKCILWKEDSFWKRCLLFSLYYANLF